MTVSKKMEGLTSTFVSIGKAMPLLLGGLGGIVLPPKGGESAVKHVERGEWNNAGLVLLANYTFFDGVKGAFDMNQGVGVKALGAGVLIHKAIGWLAE